MEDSIDTPKLFIFLSFWIAKSVLLLFFSAMSLDTLVLGNDKVSGSMTAVFAGLILTIMTFSIDFVGLRLGINTRDKNIRKVFSFVETAVLLYMFKLFAVLTGLGIASFLIVFVVAALIILIDEPLMRWLSSVKLEG